MKYESCPSPFRNSTGPDLHLETTYIMASDASSPQVVKTDLLIVGAGPAGASLACFLASHGESCSLAWISYILNADVKKDTLEF